MHFNKLQTRPDAVLVEIHSEKKGKQRTKILIRPPMPLIRWGRTWSEVSRRALGPTMKRVDGIDHPTFSPSAPLEVVGA